MSASTVATRDAAQACDVRGGVIRAIEVFGTGFLAHPGNEWLRRRLQSGELSADDLRSQLVVEVYRLLFRAVAEGRGLLHASTADCAARERYADGYSVARLIGLAFGERSYAGADLWRCVSRVRRALGEGGGCAELGLVGLGSFLWDAAATPDLCEQRDERATVQLADEDLLLGVRALFCGDESAIAPCVDVATIGADEFAEAYEAVLELRACADVDACRFTLERASVNDRRATGSFYTPERVVAGVLDMSLEPLVEERLAVAGGGAEALLSIRVCDPSCGSGHFLVAAARRIADRVARLRAREDGSGIVDYRRALRDVAGRCVYGVDLSEMAVELCKIALWLEVAEPGLALSSWDHCLKVGDSLLGCVRDAPGGIPDAAFFSRDGIDDTLIKGYRRRNKEERRQRDDGEAVLSGDSVRLLSDAWCAAFVWQRYETDALTDAVRRALVRGASEDVSWFRDEVERLVSDYRFFHWGLEFPSVFVVSEEGCGGFDVVIGNPPFLSQLGSLTANERGAAAMLREATGGAVAGYADPAAAFLHRAVELAAPGARIAMVMPQSFLASKDAGGVRSAVLSEASLSALWVAGEHVFEGAGVFTCAPALYVGERRAVEVQRWAGGSFREVAPVVVDNDELRDDETWAPLAAAALGVPELTLRGDTCIGDIAHATADFRDQYYGLDGFLIEDTDAPNAADSDYPPIVTSGLIDLAACKWGAASTRIHKTKWAAPRIDGARLMCDGELAPWLEARLVPKVLVATQTKVIEAYVDESGRLAPCTPLITVTPKSPGDLWKLAAAVASPVCGAVALQRYSGTALNARAIKLSAKQILRLPLPVNETAWASAASMFRQAQRTTDQAERRRCLLTFAIMSCEAYALHASETGTLIDWWVGRAGLR